MKRILIISLLAMAVGILARPIPAPVANFQFSINPMLEWEFCRPDTLHGTSDNEGVRQMGFREIGWVDHTSAFFFRYDEGHLDNMSPDGINTELFVGGPYYCSDSLVEDGTSFRNPMEFLRGEQHQTDDRIEWEDGQKARVLHSRIEKATVFGIRGYRLVEYQASHHGMRIREVYAAYRHHPGKGICFYSTVTYSTDREDITFEQMEQRRRYLGPLCERYIAEARMYICKPLK